MKGFPQNIIDWYERNKRPLPWREDTEPYKVWLSEIILQQTRVEQGTPYFEKFIDHYPNVHDLAEASEDKVLKLWQGLGYYSRARNLHTTAKYISQKRGGIFPDNYDELLQLKGVGSYTAAAIASISFNQPISVVDGNVLRVYSRIFNDESPINEERTKKNVFQKLNSIIPPENPASFNQGMMELGSLICTPNNPKCNECPVQFFCKAYIGGTQLELPKKSKKQKVTSLNMDFFHFMDSKNQCFITQRTSKGIWARLFEFPNLENSSDEEIHQFISENSKNSTLLKSISFKHILSHRKINARFHFIRCEKLSEDSSFKRIDFSTIHHFALHRLMTKYLESYNIFE